MESCIHCGVELLEEAKFCSNCGKAISVLIEDESIKQDNVSQERPSVKHKKKSVSKNPIRKAVKNEDDEDEKWLEKKGLIIYALAISISILIGYLTWNRWGIILSLISSFLSCVIVMYTIVIIKTLITDRRRIILFLLISFFSLFIWLVLIKDKNYIKIDNFFSSSFSGYVKAIDEVVNIPWYQSKLYVDPDETSINQIDRSQPYADILDDLVDLKDNIKQILYYPSTSRITVIFINDWNDDDANKIGNIVMKTLPFEPRWIDDHGYLTHNIYQWTAGTYNVTLGYGGSYSSGFYSNEVFLRIIYNN